MHIGWVDHGVLGSLIGMVVGAIGGFIAGAFLAGALIPLSLLAGLAIVLWALQYLQTR